MMRAYVTLFVVLAIVSSAAATFGYGLLGGGNVDRSDRYVSHHHQVLSFLKTIRCSICLFALSKDVL
uniref:Uncharacterized protein n=1 Tax=Anopheles atroparvus TaxID=41427 RepID=A0A182JG39_ANOAO